MSRDVERRVCLCERHFVRLGRRSVWKYIFANLIVMFRTCVSVFLYIFVVCNNMYVVYIEICMRMAAMHFIVVSSRSIRFRFIHFFFVGFYLSPLATISCVYIWLYKLDFPYR